MDTRPEEINVDESLINYADLKRFGENIDKHYASVNSLNAKANVSEVYTRQEVDSKLAGLSATEGAKGDKGDPGEQGPRGEKGDTGAPGKDGAAGKSAYDIAVENGFTGTEAEWLDSLKGEKGEAGDGADIDTSAFAKKEDLEGLAKTSDIPDVSGFATKEDIPDVSGLAKASDIPDVSDFAKKEDIPTVPDMSEYAKTSDIPAQKTLAELGGVTQAGVESIVQAKGFTTEDVVAKMIQEAIEKALKNQSGGDTPAPTPDPEPTPEPQPEPTDSDWKWTKYFVVPAGTTDITADLDGFVGDTITCDDMIGPTEDMRNTTVEVRAIGNLRTGQVNAPTYLVDDPDKLNFAIDFRKKYVDGLRMPIDGFCDTAEYEAALDSFHSPNVGWACYDGEAVLDLSLGCPAMDRIYMIRKLKTGTIPEFKVGNLVETA